MAIMTSNMVETIRLITNRLNDNIDMTNLPDYEDRPFVPVIYKETDSGGMSPEVIPGLVGQTIKNKQVIYISFQDPSLLEEDMFSTSSPKMRSWFGVVGVNLLVKIPNDKIDEFSEIFKQVETVIENHFKQELFIYNIFGEDRSVEINVPRLIDNAGSLIPFNSKDVKQISFAVSISVAPKGLMRANRVRYYIDGVDSDATSKQFEYRVSMTISKRKVLAVNKADNLANGYTITVPVDFDKPFIDKLYTLSESTGKDGLIETTTFALRRDLILPDGTVKSSNRTVKVKDITELAVSNGFLYWQIGFGIHDDGTD